MARPKRVKSLKEKKKVKKGTVPPEKNFLMGDEMAMAPKPGMVVPAKKKKKRPPKKAM